MIDLRELLVVNDFEVRLKPYTEKRRKELEEVDNDIRTFVEKQDKGWDDIPVSVKAGFWKRKAMILWEPKPNEEQLRGEFWDAKTNFFTDGFFEDEGFEYPLLQKSEFFFPTMRIYL